VYNRITYRPDRTAVYCDWDAKRVVIYDHSVGSAIAMFEIAATQFSCDLTWDTRVLLTTNWDRHGVDVWDVPSQTHRQTVPVPFKVGRLVCDRDGQHIAFLLRKGFYATNLRTLSVVRIYNCNEDLDFASFSSLRNHLLVPMLRVGKIMEILFNDLTVHEVAVPVDGMAQWVQHFPDGTRYAVIDTKRSIQVFDTASHSPLWATLLSPVAGKDHIGVGRVSGDGTIVAAVITRRSSNDLVTLDAENGTVLNHFVGVGGWCGLPHGKTLVLSQEKVNSPDDAIPAFNLATGELETVALNGNQADEGGE
jgi:hypothetical protein